MDYENERCELAAAFRLAFRENWHEGVANHISLAVSDDGKKFLINPAGIHFSRVKASDLLLCDADNPDASLNQKRAPDPTAWGIHSAFHRNEPRARACFACSCNERDSFLMPQRRFPTPIDQNTARFFNRYGYDDGYEGMGFDSEGERISKTLGPHRILVMGNHGVMAAAESVARAFDELYYFERACETYIKAAATGLPLKVLGDNVAESTAQEWENYPGEPWQKHFDALMAILDEEEPGFRT